MHKNACTHVHTLVLTVTSKLNSFGTCSSSWFQCPYGNIWCEICHFMVRPSSLSIHLYLELHNHKWQISRPFSLRKGNKRFIISSPPPPIVLLLSAEQHWSWCCVNAGVGLTEPHLVYLPHTVLHHIAIAACSVCGQESLHCAPE